MSACASCGKGFGDLKACTACKLVKYCNVACQKAHRPKHKKECRKRAAEIFDEALFKTPPPKEDCPICFLRLPLIPSETQYRPCCGKIICCGCAYAKGIGKASMEHICPFCRAHDETTDVGLVERLKERIEVDDAIAIFNLGCMYKNGEGVPQDSNKALELLHQSAKLGCAESHCDIGAAYFYGNGVEKDVKKGIYHWELVA
ncbi:hypothetical protein ACHAXR_002442 [Thalassiosira sp. AJA248-18]